MCGVRRRLADATLRAERRAGLRRGSGIFRMRSPRFQVVVVRAVQDKILRGWCEPIARSAPSRRDAGEVLSMQRVGEPARIDFRRVAWQ